MAQVEPPESVAGIDTEQLERLLGLLRDHLPKVLESNRFFEEETGFHNEAGANNLVDALSHVGTLAENASSLSREEQRDEVTNFADHLRRSMMEGFERTLKHRLGELSERWEEYQREARPLQAQGRLRGVPTPDALDTQRRRVRNLLHDGRASKRGSTWADWKAGTDCLAEACHGINDLATQVEQCIGAAREYQSERQTSRRSRIYFVVSTAIGLGGLALAILSYLN